MRYAVSIALAVAACATPPPLVTPADADRAHVPIAELQQGRDLLIAKCAACHDVPVPTAQTPAQWPAQLDDMGKRAALEPLQRHLIEQYVLAMDLR